MDALALGRYLRETREAKELTLDDAAQVLHIRRLVLEAFELGDFNVTGASAVQVRGFVRNYATYLGLDADRVAQFYDSALMEAERQDIRRRGKRKSKRETDERPLVAPRAVTDTNPSLPRITFADHRAASARRGSMLNMLVLLLVGLAAVAVIVFVVVELLRQPESSLPSGDADVPNNLADLPLPPTRTPVPTFTPISTSTELPRAVQAYNGQGVMVTIELIQRSWIYLEADGVERYAAIAPPEMILEYQAQSEIKVSASNAAALMITYNGQQQRSFGRRGQKVDLTFTLTGVDVQTGPGFEPTAEVSPTPKPRSESIAATLLAELTPTVTLGPSPTPTNTPTITLTPSITFTPSNTPTPSDTPTATYTPSNTPTPSDTPTATHTPTDTATPTLTLTPSITPTPSDTPTPSPTAILPPRVTQENLPPTKPGS